MTGTIQTTSSLITEADSVLATGQAASAITAARLRQLIEDVVVSSVSLKTVLQFGADPTGATDSTTAFQNAMAAGPCLVPAFQSDGVTRAVYRVQNCIVPNGATLIGGIAPAYALGGRNYFGFGNLSGNGFVVPPMIAPLSSSTTRLFNVHNRAGISFQNLLLDCSNVSGFTQGAATQVCDGISAGGMTMDFQSVAFYYCKNGIGGQVTGTTFTGTIAATTLTVSSAAGGLALNVGDQIYGIGVTTGTQITALGSGTGGNGTYTVSISQSVGPVSMSNEISGGFPANTWIGNIRNCSFMYCVNGLNDVIDNHITDSWFSGCQNGANLTPNSSASTFTDCRFEWCGITTANTGAFNWAAAGSGITLGGCTSLQFIGCYFDTNGLYGVDATSAFQIMFVGCYFQDNGINTTVAGGTTLLSTSAHIGFNGSFNIFFVGCHSRGDVNQGPSLIAGGATALYAPAAAVHFSGSNGFIMFDGCDFSGYQGSTTGGSKTAPQNSPTTWKTGSDPATAATTTGSISVATMTVTSGTGIAIGQRVLGVGVIPGTTISGGSGTSWTVYPSQTVASTTIITYSTAQANPFIVKGCTGMGGFGYDLDSR